MIHVPAGGKGVAVSLLGPVSATLPDGTKINVTTARQRSVPAPPLLLRHVHHLAFPHPLHLQDYPFGDDVSIALTSIPGAIATYPVYVRIPNWATAATITINGGDPVNVGPQNGTM